MRSICLKRIPFNTVNSLENLKSKPSRSTWLEEKKKNCSKNLIGAINWGGKGAFAAVGSAALIMRRRLTKTEFYFSLAG